MLLLGEACCWTEALRAFPTFDATTTSQLGWLGRCRTGVMDGLLMKSEGDSDVLVFQFG